MVLAVVAVALSGCPAPEAATDAGADAAQTDARPSSCPPGSPPAPGAYALTWACDGACPGGAPMIYLDTLEVGTGLELRYSGPCVECAGLDQGRRARDAIEGDGIRIGAYRSEPYTLCSDRGHLRGLVTWTGPPGPDVARTYTMTGTSM